MSAWTGRNSGVLNPWLHVVLWWFVIMTGGMFAMTVIVAIDELIFRKPPPSDYLIFLAGSALLLAALLRFWRRYWFLVSDLQRLLQARGGLRFQVRRRWLRPRVKARMGDLWVLSRFDHPMYDYRPSRASDFGASGLLKSPRKWTFMQRETWKWRGGFRPGYMLSLSRVNFFRLADFSRLPQENLEVTKQWSAEHPVSHTNDAVFDNALREASGAITDPGLTLTVEIREKWLRVEVKGGTWLGTIFGQRISEALDFTERLITRLAPRFTPLEPDEWTIDLVDEEFVVKPTTKNLSTHGSDRPTRQVGTLSVLLTSISTHFNWMTYLLPSAYSGFGWRTF